MSQGSTLLSKRIDFTIKSIELRDYSETHGCVVVSHVDANKLLVKLDPVIPGWVYNMSKDLCDAVLAPRYKGTSLWPVVSEWPFKANICIPKPQGDWLLGPWRLLDIGLLEMVPTRPRQ